MEVLLEERSGCCRSSGSLRLCWCWVFFRCIDLVEDVAANGSIVLKQDMTNGHGKPLNTVTVIIGICTGTEITAQLGACGNINVAYKFECECDMTEAEITIKVMV